MTTYNVYLPPIGSPEEPSDNFRLVADKKAPWALIIPIFWLLYHRLWLPLLGYAVITAAILLLLSYNQHPAIAYLSVLPGFYLLLEGQELVRGKLERMGWQYDGIVEGDDQEEAEIRYIAKKSQKFDVKTLHVASTQTLHRKPQLKTQTLFPE